MAAFGWRNGMGYAQQPQVQTTTVHQVVQPACGPSQYGQPVMGQPVQYQQGGGFGTTTTTMSTFNVQQRRRRAYMSCCGHTTVWTTLGLSLVMLVVGIILISVFHEDKRSPRISAYNDYVKSWKNYISEQQHVATSNTFSVQWELFCRTDSMNGTEPKYAVQKYNSSTLDIDTTNSDLKKDSGGFPLEPQYKFKYHIDYDNVDYEQCYLHNRYYKVDSAGNRNILFERKADFVEWRSFRCDGGDNDDYYKCLRKCHEKHYGDMHGRTCVYPMALKKMCIKVRAVTKSGKLDYVIDKDYPQVRDPSDSGGCYYSRRTNSFRYYHFENENVRHPHKEYYNGTNHNYDVEFVVRYSQDAWLGYMRVTENSGYFGDENDGGLIAGICLLLAGVLLLGLFAFLLITTRRKVDRINAMEDTSGEISGCFHTVW